MSMNCLWSQEPLFKYRPLSLYVIFSLVNNGSYIALILRNRNKMAWDGTRACMPTWSLPTMPHLRLPPFPPGPAHCYIPTYSLPTMSCLLLLSPNETLPPCTAPWWPPAWILSTMPCPCIAGFHAAVPGYPYTENSHYATQYHRVPIKHAAVLPSTSVSWYWATMPCSTNVFLQSMPAVLCPPPSPPSPSASSPSYHVNVAFPIMPWTQEVSSFSRYSQPGHVEFFSVFEEQEQEKK